jgi:[ribosomal protein S5]-alanine N-acetyltransferase
MLEEKYETGRLILRKPKFEDHIGIYNNWAQDKDVTKYLEWVPHNSIDTTKEFINICIKQWNDKRIFPFIICIKETGEIAGMIDFRFDAFKINFGYVLAKKHWNKGYMTEALNFFINELMKLPDIFRIWAICDVDNKGSEKVMKKSGMVFEGILHRNIIHPNISLEPRDSKLYAIVK